MGTDKNIGWITPYQRDTITLYKQQGDLTVQVPAHYHRLEFPTKVHLHKSESFWQLTVVLLGFGFWIARRKK